MASSLLSYLFNMDMIAWTTQTVEQTDRQTCFRLALVGCWLVSCWFGYFWELGLLEVDGSFMPVCSAYLSPCAMPSLLPAFGLYPLACCLPLCAHTHATCSCPLHTPTLSCPCVVAFYSFLSYHLLGHPHLCLLPPPVFYTHMLLSVSISYVFSPPPSLYTLATPCPPFTTVTLLYMPYYLLSLPCLSCSALPACSMPLSATAMSLTHLLAPSPPAHSLPCEHSYVSLLHAKTCAHTGTRGGVATLSVEHQRYLASVL